MGKVNDYNYQYLGCSEHISPKMETLLNCAREICTFNAFKQRCNLIQWSAIRDFAKVDDIEGQALFFKATVNDRRYYVMHLTEEGGLFTHVWSQQDAKKQKKKVKAAEEQVQV